jgi:hypothetical protein
VLHPSRRNKQPFTFTASAAMNFWALLRKKKPAGAQFINNYMNNLNC